MGFITHQYTTVFAREKCRWELITQMDMGPFFFTQPNPEKTHELMDTTQPTMLTQGPNPPITHCENLCCCAGLLCALPLH